MPEIQVIPGVRTENLKTGDKILFQPPYKMDLRGRRIRSVENRFNVWVDLEIADVDLPRTKRWKSNWEWTVERELPTEREQLLETVSYILENIQHQRVRATESYKIRRDALVQDIDSLTGFHMATSFEMYMKARTKMMVWKHVEARVEEHNEAFQRSGGLDLDTAGNYARRKFLQGRPSHLSEKDWDREWSLVDGLIFHRARMLHAVRDGVNQYIRGGSNSTNQMHNAIGDLEINAEWDMIVSAYGDLGRHLEKYEEARAKLDALPDPVVAEKVEEAF